VLSKHAVSRIALQRDLDRLIDLAPLRILEPIDKVLSLEPDGRPIARVGNVAFQPLVAAGSFPSHWFSLDPILVGEELKTHLFECPSLACAACFDFSEIDALCHVAIPWFSS
jgi:hypothetical protein